MGPGLAIKALAGNRFSLLSFGIAQAAMDIEPLTGMLRGASVLHGWTHTWLAALIIGGAVALASPPLCRPLLRGWNRETSHHRLPWLASPPPPGRAPAVIGALTGTLSHVALDSLMHSDMTPLSPWSNTNSLLDLVTIPTLHQGCIVSGVTGLALWLFIQWRKRHGGVATENTPPSMPG